MLWCDRKRGQRQQEETHDGITMGLAEYQDHVDSTAIETTTNLSGSPQYLVSKQYENSAAAILGC